MHVPIYSPRISIRPTAIACLRHLWNDHVLSNIYKSFATRKKTVEGSSPIYRYISIFGRFRLWYIRGAQCTFLHRIPSVYFFVPTIQFSPSRPHRRSQAGYVRIIRWKTSYAEVWLSTHGNRRSQRILIRNLDPFWLPPERREGTLLAPKSDVAIDVTVNGWMFGEEDYNVMDIVPPQVRSTVKADLFCYRTATEERCWALRSTQTPPKRSNGRNSQSV